jgi:outer membrane protein assembly factor BamA
VNCGIERKEYKAQGLLPDISYNQNPVYVKINAHMPGLENLSFSFGADFEKRYFTTANSFQFDPYHRDRIDTKYSFNIGTDYSFSSSLKLSFDYTKEARRVWTPYQVDIEEIKDYDNNQYSLGLIFNPRVLIEGD